MILNDSSWVTNLNQTLNNLPGELPTELGTLKQLTDLDLSFNEFSGPLNSLGVLPRLRTLLVGSNLLTGSLPSELGKFMALTEINLEANLLTGTIPSEFGILSSLKDFDVNSNQLKGR
jgi:Leucine-rich repeat (LRR) protein